MKIQEKDNYLTISEFSRISEIKRKALIFYDNTGVFSPKYTAPNGYRYYTHDQIYHYLKLKNIQRISLRKMQSLS